MQKPFSSYKNYKIIAQNEICVDKKISYLNRTTTKADKGNCTVIMNKVDYINNTHQTIIHSGCTEIKVDPLKSYLNISRSTLKDSSATLAFFDTKLDKHLSKNLSFPNSIAFQKSTKSINAIDL